MGSRPPPYWGFPPNHPNSVPPPGSPPRTVAGPPMMPPGSPLHFLNHPPPPQMHPQQVQFPFFMPYPQQGMFPQAPISYPPAPIQPRTPTEGKKLFNS